MIFEPTDLPGVFSVYMERLEDPRGFFARTWCQREFEAHGMNGRVVQCNVSFNRRRGTLRGLHYQAAPYWEAKLVRSTRGAVYDVIVDLRPDSATYMRWIGITLTADSYDAVYIPEGMAHGFQTLADDTEVFYQMSEFFQPEYARGIRWNDPAFSIRWPLPVAVISEKDQSYAMWGRD